MLRLDLIGASVRKHRSMARSRGVVIGDLPLGWRDAFGTSSCTSDARFKKGTRQNPNLD